MKFQGLWSPETHPKDFPSALWLTHFSDIIGASHDKNFSFWAEGQWATDGVRQLAEWGSTAILESELRQRVNIFEINYKIKLTDGKNGSNGNGNVNGGVCV